MENQPNTSRNYSSDTDAIYTTVEKIVDLVAPLDSYQQQAALAIAGELLGYRRARAYLLNLNQAVPVASRVGLLSPSDFE